CHPFDGGFGHGIGDNFGDAVLGSHRADVDDISFSMGKHGFYYFAGDGENRSYVGQQDAVEVFIGNIGQLFFHIDASVVDEDIDPVVALDDAADEAGYGVEVV